MTEERVDIAIIGAGLAGLTCAQSLHHAGNRAIVLEKSRGLGGRATTRRFAETCIDRGLPYLEDQGELTRKAIADLQQADLLQPWGENLYSLRENGELAKIPVKSRYILTEGMSAIAKFLRADLEVRRNHRVTALSLSPENLWQIHLDPTPDDPPKILAKAVVLGIPAPQAEALVRPLAPAFLPSLQSVEFNPCITVAAAYPASQPRDWSWQGLKIEQDGDLAWIIDDSSKRQTAPQPILVFHSTPEFARDYLDVEDLQSGAKRLLSKASELLWPGLREPEWWGVHRWRYARPRRSLNTPCLSATEPLPLVCCGDWCLGDRAEDALKSGLAAAEAIASQLR